MTTGRLLSGRVALVTGASRGVGRGIALGLAEAGALVYVAGRTLHEDPAAPLGGSLAATAAQASELGGVALPVRCDAGDDEEVRALVARVEAEQGRLDVLVNSAWGGYEHFHNGTEFWREQGFWDVPFARWTAMFDRGVRAQYVTSALAAPLLRRTGAGLVVHVSSDAAERDDLGAAYSAAKAASDRLAACMAHDLRASGVCVVSLWPGLVRTEGVLRAAEHFDLTASESPRVVGRCVAGLAGDPDRMAWSGRVQRTDELARRYGLVDPEPLS